MIQNPKPNKNDTKPKTQNQIKMIQNSKPNKNDTKPKTKIKDVT